MDSGQLQSCCRLIQRRKSKSQPFIQASLDGTWHRPFTTLELASLQSLVDPEEYLKLDGLSDADWRERIGNAVPPDAAQAIADTMGTTLLLAWSGESFMLSAVPVWVQQMAVGLSLDRAARPCSGTRPRDEPVEKNLREKLKT
ncbi:DNA cytosine methyltransferase [Acidisoma silvae]|uniref:DNA cytosine methyltransferase n=1 Tax=Acidisoma silvae TaxID=2802396 RepID=UPI001D09FCBF|nr:DNA cytosine methyltransferase [Acidisoma silvae]